MAITRIFDEIDRLMIQKRNHRIRLLKSNADPPLKKTPLVQENTLIGVDTYKSGYIFVKGILKQSILKTVVLFKDITSILKYIQYKKMDQIILSSILIELKNANNDNMVIFTVLNDSSCLAELIRFLKLIHSKGNIQLDFTDIDMISCLLAGEKTNTEILGKSNERRRNN